MKRRRLHRSTWTLAVIACAVVVGAEAWWLWVEVGKERAARAIMSARASEIALLQSLDPAPNVGNEERLHAQRTQLEARIADSINVRPGHVATSMDDGSEQLDPADVYFRLVAYVEGWRRTAVSAGIEVAPDERFGFREYANAGPSPASAAAILRQAAALQLIFDKLIEAQPREILRVQRGRRLESDVSMAQNDRQLESGDSEDHFEVVRRDSTGQFASSPEMTFRVEFIGPASSLRSLLNDYAALGSPVIVRQVEVARATRSRRDDRGREDGSADRLLTEEPLCRFSVVAEVMSQPADLSSDHVLQQTRAFRWEEPAAQSRGTEWKFEVFGAPRIFQAKNGERAVQSEMENVSPTVSTDTGMSFGLLLLSLEAELFRLQLVGFAGEPDRPIGVFENAETGEVFLAGAGQRLSRLSASIATFNVKLTELPMPDGGSTKLRVGTATVRDERSGELVYLTTAERRFSREPVARIAFDRANAASRSVRAGDVIEEGSVRYRIDAVRASGGEIVVTREGPGHERETRTLRVRNSALAQAETSNH